MGSNIELIEFLSKCGIPFLTEEQDREICEIHESEYKKREEVEIKHDNTEMVKSVFTYGDGYSPEIYIYRLNYIEEEEHEYRTELELIDSLPTTLITENQLPFAVALTSLYIMYGERYKQSPKYLDTLAKPFIEGLAKVNKKYAEFYKVDCKTNEEMANFVRNNEFKYWKQVAIDGGI